MAVWRSVLLVQPDDHHGCEYAEAERSGGYATDQGRRRPHITIIGLSIYIEDEKTDFSRDAGSGISAYITKEELIRGAVYDHSRNGGYNKGLIGRKEKGAFSLLPASGLTGDTYVP